MTLFNTQSIVDQLEDVLDKEYRLMLAVDFSGLARLLPEKEALFDKVAQQQIDPLKLRHMRDRAERNKIMLDCVTRGVKSAVERLDRINSPNADLKTYDGLGRRKTFGTDDHTLRRRA